MAKPRKRPEPLPHKKVAALSGVFYRDYMAMLEADSGDSVLWIVLG